MNLSIFQQTNPVSAGHSLVMAIYKNSAPSVLIDHFQIPGPYTGATSLHTFSGLQNVVYNYKLFESPDGSATGTVRNAFDIQPNQNAFNVRDDLYLVANTAPFLTSGNNFYGQDPSLIGWNWGLERVPGTIEYGVDYTKTVAGVPTSQDDTNADGWVLLAAGDLVGDGEKFVIHFLPQLSATSTASSGTFISGTQRLTSNTVLDNTAVGQAFLLQGGGGFIGITLPDIATVADNEPIFFNSAGGSHVNAGLTCFSGQQLEWYNNQTLLGSNTRASALFLGQCENGYVYKFTYPDASTRWIVFGCEGALLTGEFIYDYSKIPLNTVFANGQLLSRANYPRLWAWVQNLESGLLIADSAYNNTTTVNGVTYQSNWGRYTVGDGSTTFRLPTLWKYGYLRFKSGVAGSGNPAGLAADFDAQQVGIHDHATHGKGGIVGAGLTWFLSLINGRYSAGGGSDKFGGQSTTPDTNMRTSDNINKNTAGENLPSSNGCYALIRC